MIFGHFFFATANYFFGERELSPWQVFVVYLKPKFELLILTFLGYKEYKRLAFTSGPEQLPILR